MNKFRVFKTLIISACVMGVLMACDEDNETLTSKVVVPIPDGPGVYILNEGAIGGNNSSLTHYNFGTQATTADVLSTSPLGDTGQDMIAYGSKLYIAVNVSSNVTVLNLQTGVLQRIPLFNGNAPRSPRYLASYNGKVYVTAYDGTLSRIDTASLAVEQTLAIEGASKLEGIAAANGKLYIANYRTDDDYNVFDSYIFIVDIATFAKDNQLEVGTNPYIVRADAKGDIYVTHQGDFALDKGGLQRIDKSTNAVTDVNTGDLVANCNFTILGNDLYFFGRTYNADYSTNNSLGIFNIENQQVTPIITDGTTFDTVYGIGVNPTTGDVFISNTNYADDGEVYVFGTDGVKKKTIPVGINANAFVFN
ncbi:hypothetical protein AGMMS49982_23860 [Bacteroidia bacterium]|nr:hypothetical protein AGMMS49982_23860 [Bacteroidia bacterium]